MDGPTRRRSRLDARTNTTALSCLERSPRRARPRSTDDRRVDRRPARSSRSETASRRSRDDTHLEHLLVHPRALLESPVAIQQLRAQLRASRRRPAVLLEKIRVALRRVEHVERVGDAPRAIHRVRPLERQPAEDVRGRVLHALDRVVVPRELAQRDHRASRRVGVARREAQDRLRDPQRLLVRAARRRVAQAREEVVQGRVDGLGRRGLVGRGGFPAAEHDVRQRDALWGRTTRGFHPSTRR